MRKNFLKFTFLAVMLASMTGCFLIPDTEPEVIYYSSGLIAEVDMPDTNAGEDDRLYLNNITGRSITGVKLVYGESIFDEFDPDAEPTWDDYDYVTREILNDKSKYVNLDVAESLSTLWVLVEAGNDRHVVFSVVYEDGRSIHVNIRQSEN